MRNMNATDIFTYGTATLRQGSELVVDVNYPWSSSLLIVVLLFIRRFLHFLGSIILHVGLEQQRPGEFQHGADCARVLSGDVGV